MKKTSLIFTFVILTYVCNSQVWSWAKRQTGGTPANTYEGWAVSTDITGNVFSTGTCNKVAFGTYTINSTAIGMYLAKYDPSGNPLWASGAINSQGIAVTTDTPGNSFVTGNFAGPITAFGTNTLINAGSSGTADIYLTKYDPNGNVLWAKSSGNAGSDYGQAVCADGSGNVFITGCFNSAFITFGTYTVTNSGPAGTNDIFLAKYDANGNVLWAKDFGNISDDRAQGICADQGGNIIFTGFFKSSSLALGTYTLNNTGGQDFLLAKFDTNGNVLWATSSSGSSDDEGRSVSSTSGNIFVTGSFNSTSISFGTYTLTNSGSYDAFTAKFDPNGNPLWAKKSGGVNGEFGFSISAYAGDIFVTMSTTSNPFIIGTYTLAPPSGSTDPMIIAQYDLNGNLVHVEELTSGGDDMAAVSLDKFCNAYITGDFYSTPFVLGTNTLNPVNGCAPGCETIFVAKFSFNCQPDNITSLSNYNYHFSIYPNPTEGSFKLLMEEGIENADLSIFNSIGQLVHSQKIVKGENNITTFNLGKGLYNCVLLNYNVKINCGKLAIE